MLFQCPLSELPPKKDLETIRVLKRVNDANRELAVLKGYARTIPNQNILVRALGLQEAKDSSEIESIITTTDELYRAELFKDESVSPQTKEVRNYAEALFRGYDLLCQGQILTTNNVCAVQRVLEGNDAGLRKQSGTTLKNAATGEIVYTPPQNPDDIVRLMANLEQIVNSDETWPGVDPLIKMAAIHYQFESIHPFYDGNGRTGRILNVLYLVLKGLLDAPILYLSRYIISHKGEYYRRFQLVREHDDWESFVLFMLDAVVETSRMTARTVQDIDRAMLETKNRIRSGFPFYSRDLNEALYLYPYTRIGYLQSHLKIARNTAASYLNKLADAGILQRVQRGHNVYFVNVRLFEILAGIPTESDRESPAIVTENA